MESTMEITYIWVDNYNSCLINKEFNFGSKYKLNLSSDRRVLIIKKNDDYLADFYGKNITNITALIGENGTGKTSALDLILRNLTKNLENIQTKGIYVIKTESECSEILRIFIHEDFQITIDNKAGIKCEMIYFKTNRDSYYKASFSDKYKVEPLNTSFIYLSNIVDSSLIKRNYAYCDLTKNSYLDKFANKPYKVAREYADLMETNDIINYIYYAKENNINTDKFDLREEVELDTIRLDDIKEYFQTQGYNRNEFESVKNTYDNIKKQHGKFKYRFLLALGLFYSNHSDFSGDLFIQSTRDYSSLKSFVKNEVKKAYCDDLLKIVSLNKIIDFIDGIKSLSPETGNNGAVKIYLNEDNRLKLSNFIIELCKHDYDFQIINLRWNELSTGQRAFLNLFSRINSINEINNNVVLLIDEGETFLHPNWQREFVNLLVKIVPNILQPKIINQSKKMNMQIILTSNTPFVLSDLLSSDVIYLGNNNYHGCSFGSNIHSLLKNEFFMKNTMGAFAKEKIEYIARTLVSDIDGFESTYYLKFLNQCGEPAVKNKLTDLYNKKFKKHQNDELVKELNELLKEKEILLVNDLNSNISNIIKVIDLRINEIRLMLGDLI